MKMYELFGMCFIYLFFSPHLSIKIKYYKNRCNIEIYLEGFSIYKYKYE